MSIYDDVYREALHVWDEDRAIEPEREMTAAELAAAHRCPYCDEQVTDTPFANAQHMIDRHMDMLQERLRAAQDDPDADLPF